MADNGGLLWRTYSNPACFDIGGCDQRLGMGRICSICEASAQFARHRNQDVGIERRMAGGRAGAARSASAWAFARESRLWALPKAARDSGRWMASGPRVPGDREAWGMSCHDRPNEQVRHRRGRLPRPPDVVAHRCTIGHSLALQGFRGGGLASAGRAAQLAW
jgi:hypothetical protein